MIRKRIIDVYCDGSVSRQAMDDPLRAHYSGFVGRVAMVIPALNYGLIERFYESVTLPNGFENSVQAEINAIAKADEVSRMKDDGTSDFLILSDCPKAMEIAKLPNVRCLRSQEIHYADAYLKKMLARSNYLRRTEGKVAKRKTLSAKHLEIERLMNSHRIEFELSDSPLYRQFTQSVSERRS